MTPQAHTSDSLLPCPFSGHADDASGPTQESALNLRQFKSPAGGMAVWVECCCGAQGKACREDWQAIAAWNRRALAAPGGEGGPVAWPDNESLVNAIRAGVTVQRNGMGPPGLNIKIGALREALNALYALPPEPVAWRPDRAAVLKVLHEASVPAPVGRAYIVPTELIPVLADAILALAAPPPKGGA